MQVHVPVTLPGYRPPAPQELSIDEIRPPIPWYQPDPEEDEFNWKEIEKDLQEFDEGKVIPVNRMCIGPNVVPWLKPCRL